jgi:hypothetical protein
MRNRFRNSNGCASLRLFFIAGFVEERGLALGLNALLLAAF